MAAQSRHSGPYRCYSEEQGTRLAAESYLVAVVAGSSVTLEARAPLENLGLVWLAVVALGAVCLVLLLLVLSLRRRLREELEKGAKASERTLVYPLELPKEPASPPFRPGPETDEKLWDPVGYYYSDGSLKIVPGHARCQPGGGPFPTSWHTWPASAFSNSAPPRRWSELKCQWLCAFTVGRRGPRRIWAPTA